MNKDTKRTEFTELYKSQYSVMVAFDFTHQGAIVPEYVAQKYIDGGMRFMVFEYGKNLPIPITDLKATPEGIFATLSFNSGLHKTFVPWGAVFAFDGEVIDSPAAKRASEAPEPKLRVEKPERRRGHLRLVK